MISLKGQNTGVLTGIVVFLGIAALVFYWRVGVEDAPGDYHVKKGNYRLEDGQLDRAVEEFKLALDQNPDHVSAHLGLAISYMQMNRAEEALREFDRTIKLDKDLAVAYADRGILHDRLGRHRQALADYRTALQLDETVAEGPGWLWRFMRNIDKTPPTIRDRAEYLETELQKPPEERLLTVPDVDNQQRMYKMD